MTKRPMLILNGKARRYKWFTVSFISWGTGTGFTLYCNEKQYTDVRVSFGTRSSGRRVIWVSTEVDGENSG